MQALDQPVAPTIGPSRTSGAIRILTTLWNWTAMAAISPTSESPPTSAPCCDVSAGSSPKDLQHLWIDAICLNQDDATEKAHQVPIMGRIYKNAKGVRIWLGPEDEDTAAVFGFLHEVASAHPGTTYTKEEVRRLEVKHLHKNYAAHLNFLLRPWVFRRWVVQEAVLAHQTNSSFHCGRHFLPLDTMATVAARMKSIGWDDYAINLWPTWATRCVRGVC